MAKFGDRPIQRAATDRLASPMSVILFSVALGIGSIAIPLIALASGYDAATVGLFAVISAVAQVIGRTQVTWFLGRVADAWLIGCAALLLAASHLLLFGSTAPASFVTAMIALGLGRAFFWTGSQTHAVRTSGNAVRAMATLNVFASIGTVCGPALGGALIGLSAQSALGAAAFAAVFAAALASGLRIFPTYDRDGPRGEPRLWRRPGVDAACWASFAGGGWRGLLNSYVPVVLVAAGHTSSTIGVLMSLAEAVAIASSALLVRLPARHVMAGVVGSVVLLGLATAAIPFVAEDLTLAGVALGFSGAAGGIVTTLGPAVAAERVSAGQVGAAIAVTGTFRALGLLALPFGVAVALSVIPAAPAMALAGASLGIPSLVVSLVNRAQRRDRR